MTNGINSHCFHTLYNFLEKELILYFFKKIGGGVKGNDDLDNTGGIGGPKLGKT